MERPLVWVPPEMTALIEHAPAEIEVAAIPEDPESNERLGDVEVLVFSPMRDRMSPLFPKMARLRLIQTTSAGIDGIVKLVPDGVVLCSARGSYEVCAEWVVGAIVADYKNFAFSRDEQVQGRWTSRRARRVEGSTVLLLGYGSISKGVEARLAPFGARFLRVARSPRPEVETLDQLPRLLPEADVVVLAVPLTAETTGLVDRRFLEQMKPGALLVNVARGPVVDTDALIEAASAGTVHAALDVTDPEPLPENHPLFSTPNVFITPHISGGPLAREDVAIFLEAQLGRLAHGETLMNVVSDGY